MSQQVLIQTTADGSNTLFVPSIDEHYHSINGAIQESLHVYIDAGLKNCVKDDINILEIGFGTGLNAFLTLLETTSFHKKINYTGIELYPLADEIIQSLNYTNHLTDADCILFNKIHQIGWGREEAITEFFTLQKIQADFTQLNIQSTKKYDLIYFDAFAPEKQIDMWNQEIFDFLYNNTNIQGILTTYCAKGTVRRMLQQAGYSVERLQGPPGKREMLRATKLDL